LTSENIPTPIPARMAIIAMVTRSSVNVKCFFTVLFSVIGVKINTYLSGNIAHRNNVCKFFPEELQFFCDFPVPALSPVAKTHLQGYIMHHNKIINHISRRFL
jgi:hypothetical protein